MARANFWFSINGGLIGLVDKASCEFYDFK